MWKLSWNIKKAISAYSNSVSQTLPHTPMFSSQYQDSAPSVQLWMYREVCLHRSLELSPANALNGFIRHAMLLKTVNQG